MSQFELVFSRYNEDVRFLDAWPHACTIYDKGDDEGCFDSKHFVRCLPNRGMDTHSILHHLAERYDTLADVTLFLAGNWTKYRDDAGRPQWADPFLEHYARRSFDPGWPLNAWRFVWDNGWPGPVKHHGKWAEMLQTGEIEPSPYTLGEWWDRVIGGERPGRIAYCPGQTFSVPREYVHHRPQAWYARLADFFAARQYPEECHHMERLWLYVFRPGGRKDVDL